MTLPWQRITHYHPHPDGDGTTAYGPPIYDDETPGTYALPYLVDLACGCECVEWEEPYWDLDKVRGNELGGGMEVVLPRKAVCPRGHGS